MIKKLKIKATNLKRETYTLYLVYQSSQVSWWKRLFLGVVIGYAFCPIDLIPDFIPILGYIDDLILVPIGISLALKLIPKEVIEECRKKADEKKEKELPIGKKTGLAIIFIWIVGLGLLFMWLIELSTIILD
ncbi:MAG: YkvA family protein [Candidatus Heimdallarchaeota archaeon]